MPDLFGYWMTGRAVSELTIATTSQAYDPRRGDWARPLLARLGIPESLFGEIIPPGSVLGPLLGEVSEEAGLGRVPVLAPGGHDTALAVAAVPSAGPDFAYVSSGTWSLLGTEVPSPVISEATLEANFTNEGGVCSTFRLLKNLCGLWLVQEARRVWARQGKEHSHTELVEAAAQAPAFRSIIDVDAPDFSAPGDMPGRMRDFCRRTAQPEPVSVGEVVRSALDSLALKYRYVLGLLEGIIGRRLSPLHIVGGGSQNRLLNQLAADVTGRPVVAGPAEATALGNLVMQALALGHLGSLGEARDLLKRSVAPETFEPRRAPGLEEAYGRLLAMIAK
jgi:rhamnulokinase